MPCTHLQGPSVEERHLNIVRDSIGNFFVEVAQGAVRIILTPPLWNLTEASDARKRIAAATGLRDGRSV